MHQYVHNEGCGVTLWVCHDQAPSAGEARADNLVLHGLAVQLGPDLRVLYPMNVLNFGIAGELVATGPADPARLKLAGTIRCGFPPRILLHDTSPFSF